MENRLNRSLFLSIATMLTIVCSFSLEAQIAARHGFTRKAHNTLSLAVSHDGSTFATGGDDNKVVLWTVADGKETTAFNGNENWVTSLAFESSGKFLAAGDKNGKIVVYDLGSGMMAYTLEGPAATVYSLDFNPRFKTIASAWSDGQLRLWDASTHQLIRAIKASDNELMTTRFSPDGTRVIAAGADGLLKEWEVSSGKLLRAIEAHPGNHIRAADYSRDGKYFATGSDDKNVRVWLTENGKLFKEMPKVHKKWVQSLRFASDGVHLATGGHDGSVILWNVMEGKVVASQRQPGLFVTGSEFTPDLKTLVSAGFEGKGNLWDISSLGLKPMVETEQAVIAGGVTSGGNTTGATAKAGNVFELIQPRLQAGGKFVLLEETLKIRGRVDFEVGVREIAVLNKQSGVREKMRRDDHGVFEHAVRLAYLDNEIVIEATDTQGKKMEKTFTAYRIFDKTNASELAQLSRSGTDYALIIATNSYQAMNPLVNPVFDANAIKSVLETEYNFQVEQLIDPSLSQITLKIREYARKLFSDDDQLFIFIAGHGEYDDFYKEGYLVATDSKKGDEAKTSYLPHSALRTYVNNIPCKHIFLAMDVCFGGTFDPHIASSRGDTDQDLAARAHFIKRKLASKTRLYLTSGGKEYVPDGRPGQHSPFARKLLEAFSSYGGSDKILTYKELLNFVEAATPEPRFGDFGDNEPGSDFIFIAR